MPATVTRYRSTHAPGFLAGVRQRFRDAGEKAGAPPENEIDVAEDAGIGLVPASYDPETREIDVVLSTGADVLRFDWWTGREFVERLDLDGAVLDRLNAGAPWLRVHNAYSLDAVLGVVKPGSVRVEGGQMLGRIRLSDTPGDAEVVRKIATGLIRGVSIGYDTEVETVEQATAGAPELRTATRWIPFEGSSVPVGADPNAGTRTRAASPAPTVTPPASPAIRQEPTMPATVTNPATGATLDEAAIRAKAATDERERAKSIRQAVGLLRLDATVAESLIDGGVELEAARTRAFALAAERDAAVKVAPHLPAATVTDDAKDKRARGMQNAILHRAMPGKFALTEEGRHFRGLDLMGLARDFLESEGISTRGMTPMDLSGRALHHRSGGGYHSVSDFPNILSDVPRKVMAKAYGEAPSTFQAIASRATLKDFRAKYAVQLGAAPALERVLENGEFKRGSIVDGAESYGLDTYGKILAIGRRVMINDDLGALTKLPAKLAAAARRLENAIVWGVVLDNGDMADGVDLFHASHNNLIDVGSGGGATVTQLAAMRSKLKMQLDLDDSTRLGLSLRTIAVPDALFTAFEKFIKGEIQPATQAEVIPGSFRNLNLITDPLLDDSSTSEWYGFADMGELDGLEYAYLEGEEGPAIDSEVDFETDGVQLRIRHDFGAGCVDHRFAVRNAGA